MVAHHPAVMSVGHVMADHTAGAGPEQGVMTGHVPRHAADNGAFQTAARLGGSRAEGEGQSHQSRYRPGHRIIP